MLNAREKLSKLETNEPGPDLHVYHPTTSSRKTSSESAPWKKIAGALRIPSAGTLRGEKRDLEDPWRTEHSREYSTAMSGTSSSVRWESMRKATRIDTISGTNATDYTHQMATTGTKRNEQVSSSVIIPISV